MAERAAETFTKFMRAQTLSDLETVAFGHALPDDERWTKRDQAVKLLMSGSLSVPAELIKQYFELAVLELGLGEKYEFYYLAHILEIIQAATKGTWRDFVTSVIYSWPLAAFIAEHEPKPNERLKMVLLGCVKELQDFTQTTRDPKARSMAQFPLQAFSLIAGMETIRGTTDRKATRERIDQLRKIAAQIDAETNNDFAFSAWVQRRATQIGI